jgi:hypothetical protein
LLVRVQEEDHERKVVIELEQFQVDVVDAGQPDADKPIGEVFDARQTDNLPVKITAARSGHTPHDDHERLAGRSRLSLARAQAEQPSVPDIRLLSEASLRPQRGLGNQNPRQRQHGDHRTSPESPRSESVFRRSERRAPRPLRRWTIRLDQDRTKSVKD